MEQSTILLRTITQTVKYEGYRAVNIEKHLYIDEDNDSEHTMYFFNIIKPTGEIFYNDRCYGSNLNDIKISMRDKIKDNLYEE